MTLVAPRAPVPPTSSPAPAQPRVGRAVVVATGLLLLVAAALRLWRLDQIVFEVDEATLLRISEDLVRLGRVPLAGPIFSTGVPSAPHFMYLIAPLVLISREPSFIAGAIALSNALAIGGTVWLGWRWYPSNPWVGWWAGALYATSALAVFSARRIWQPELLPPFSVLLLIALDRGVLGRRAWWCAAAFLITSLAVMVHPSFSVLGLFLLGPLWVLVRDRRWLPLVSGVVGALLVAVPYLLHQVQTHWVDVANLRYYSSLHTWLNLDAVRYALMMTTGWNPEGDTSVPPLDGHLPDWLLQAAAGVQVALLLAGIALALSRVRSGRGVRALRSAGLALWLLLPVAATIRHTFPLQSHYFLATYPAGFLLIASVVAVRRLRPLAAALLGGVVLIQAVATLSGLVEVGPDQACYGPSLAQATAVADELSGFGATLGSQHASLELHAGDGVAVAYLLRPHFPMLEVAGDPTTGLGPDLAHAAAVAPSVDVLTARAPLALRYPPDVEVLEVGYSAQAAPDQRVHLAVGWQVAPGASSLHPLVWNAALRQADGGVVTHLSGLDHVPAQLQGQRIVSWFSFDPPQAPSAALPSGDYYLDLQLVDAFAPGPLAYVDDAGQQGTSWTLGPLQIGPQQRCGSSGAQ